MGLIEVTGIRVFAHHGVIPAERVMGGYFRVDVRVEGDMSAAERSDDLHGTVDYGWITDVVRNEMARPADLIEHLARRILDVLSTKAPGRYTWQVRVVKERPPVNGIVQEVAYTVTG